MSIIAISGKKRCGKDTMADFMVDNYPSKFRRYALAEPIKHALLYGLGEANVMVDLEGRHYDFADINGESDVDREAKGIMDNEKAFEVLHQAWNYIVNNKPELEQFSSEIFEKIDEFYLNPEMETEWSIRRLMQTFGTDICVAVDEIIWIRFLSDVYIQTIYDKINLIVTDCRQPMEMEMMRKLDKDIFVIHIFRKGFSDTIIDTHSTERGLPIELDDLVITNNGTLDEFNRKVLDIFYKFN